MQLCLPFGAPLVVCLDEGVRSVPGLDVPVRYRLSRFGKRTTLALVRGTHKAESLSSHMAAQPGGPETTLRVVCENESDCAHRRTWDVTCAEPSTTLQAMREWVLGVLCADEGETEDMEPVVDEILSRAMLEVVRRCDADPFECAMRFHPRLRGHVYELLAQHGERIRQMADACPSLIALAACFLERGAEEAGTLVVADIQAGARLRFLLVEHLSALRSMSSGPLLVDPIEVKKQVPFFRRLPIDAPPWLVQWIPQKGHTCDDLPNDPGELSRYLSNLDVASRAPALKYMPPPARRQLHGFFSKHIQTLLDEAGGSRRGLRARVEEIADYAARSGQPVPGRRSTPSVVWGRVEAWLEASWDYHAFAPSLKLPHPDWNLHDDSLVIRPITTVGDLHKEGRAMHHCVATYAPQALQGSLYFFHAKVRGEPLTLAVMPFEDGYSIHELKSVCNEPPSKRASLAVRRWLARQGAPTRAP